MNKQTIRRDAVYNIHNGLEMPVVKFNNPNSLVPIPFGMTGSYLNGVFLPDDPDIVSVKMPSERLYFGYPDYEETYVFPSNMDELGSIA